jgi:hypothetical protein
VFAATKVVGESLQLGMARAEAFTHESDDVT